MKPSFDITYDWIEAAVRKHREALQRENFEHVVTILRGGTVPGFIAAQLLDRDLLFLSYDRKSGTPSWHSTPPKPGKTLLIDDIAGEGFTLTRCKEFLEKAGFTVKTLTLGFDERSRLAPDFSTDLSNQIMVFPWERHRLHPGFIHDLSINALKQDSSYELVALDLDGVILPDIADAEYIKDKPATLAKRDEMSPFPKNLLPPYDDAKTVIVTGRPIIDEKRTRTWLEKHGFGKLPLYMRDDDKFPHRHSAKFKATAARELGVTKFYESDLLQATMMTHYCPLLDVYCWNNDLELRIKVGTATPLVTD